MIILVSDGITNSKLEKEISKYIKNTDSGKIGLIINAKEDYNAEERFSHVETFFLDRGYSVDILDLHACEVKDLFKYNVLYLLGGNPYLLSTVLDEYDIKEVLDKFLLDGKILIGMSAGALALQKHFKIIDAFTPEMNYMNREEAKGIGLIDIQHIPHYDSFIASFENYEETCLRYEKETQEKLFRLKDGQALILNNDGSVITLVS